MAQALGGDRVSPAARRAWGCPRRATPGCIWDFHLWDRRTQYPLTRPSNPSKSQLHGKSPPISSRRCSLSLPTYGQAKVSTASFPLVAAQGNLLAKSCRGGFGAFSWHSPGLFLLWLSRIVKEATPAALGSHPAPVRHRLCLLRRCTSMLGAGEERGHGSGAAHRGPAPGTTSPALPCRGVLARQHCLPWAGSRLLTPHL